MRRHRYPLISAIIIGLLPSLAIADTPLRIATFNAEILTAPGSWAGNLRKYRWDVAREPQFERVAAVIEAINPDVLNLVEVTSKDSVDLLVKILHEKGLTNCRGYHVENNDSFTSMEIARDMTESDRLMSWAPRSGGGSRSVSGERPGVRSSRRWSHFRG